MFFQEVARLLLGVFQVLRCDRSHEFNAGELVDDSSDK
jgi:hypothetical protein